MNTPSSNDEIMKRINDRAKAEGRYLGKAFWEIPRAEGSILDVPSTPESEQRLAALRALLLERRKKAAEQTESVVPEPDVAGQEGIERGLGAFKVSGPNQQIEQDALKPEANNAEPECFT